MMVSGGANFADDVRTRLAELLETLSITCDDDFLFPIVIIGDRYFKLQCVLLTNANPGIV